MQKQFTRTHSNMAKGLAILLLLAYHLFENEELITSMEVNYAPFSLEGFLCFSGFGNICVSMFVFLTAFGIARGLEGQWSPEGLCWKSAYGQAARRFLRLMLNFTILYASVSLLWWYKFDYQSLYGAGKQGVLPLLTDALGLSMFFGTPTLNDTWWYMEIAYLLIFLVPLLAGLTEKIGWPILPLAFKLHPVLKWLAAAAGFVLCVLIRQNYMVHEYYIHLIDAPVSLFLVLVGAGVAGRVPVLGKALAFVGKHSMNIYLVHTFFYKILWRPYIYRFRYAGITFLLLLAVCLVYSVALEAVKKLIRVHRLLSY